MIFFFHAYPAVLLIFFAPTLLCPFFFALILLCAFFFFPAPTLLCPYFSTHASRADLVRSTGSEEMRRMLSTPEKAQATAQWFVKQGILQQFNLAKEIEEEEVREHTPFQPLEAEQDFRKYGNNGLKLRAKVSAEPAPAELGGQSWRTTGFLLKGVFPNPHVITPSWTRKGRHRDLIELIIIIFFYALILLCLPCCAYPAVPLFFFALTLLYLYPAFRWPLTLLCLYLALWLPLVQLYPFFFTLTLLCPYFSSKLTTLLCPFFWRLPCCALNFFFRTDPAVPFFFALTIVNYLAMVIFFPLHLPCCAYPAVPLLSSHLLCTYFSAHYCKKIRTQHARRK